ncbi:MAG TPA: DUF3131 domain-containing protein [Gammaproteobacteria bacterium]|nr:DUF3131 domain-containing protein [Gammaproteobacteria bacterium]
MEGRRIAATAVDDRDSMHLGAADISGQVSFPGRETSPLRARHSGRHGPLTEEEMKMARLASKYFENNYQPDTGLVNSMHDFPSTTMWDVASYLAGLMAAAELGIISKDEFDQRILAILATFNRLSFFRDELPNKVYNTKTLEKVNYANQPGEIGFSALDLGRLLIWLKILKDRYPQYSDAIDRFVLRWNFCHVLDKWGTMYGAVLGPDQKTMYVQEGRLGYEEYAAKGFQLWGFNTDRASKPEPYDVIPLYGIDVPYDARDPRTLHAHNYVVSESYVLDALELNWDLASDRASDHTHHSDRWAAEFADRIYKVQEARYRATGILTARTEHQLDGPPYFVYDTVFTDGYPWNTITEDGTYVPQFAAVALKGALGLWAIWRTEYTDLLFATIVGLYDPQRGYYEGLYENGTGVIKAFTANNNGIMLETLLYKVQGKLLRFSDRQSLWDKAIADQYTGAAQCFPHRARTMSTHPDPAAR